MYEHPWHEDDLDEAATNAARRFDIDDDQARDLVGLVAGALEEGGDAVDDAAWDIHQHYPDVPGEDFVDDIATALGYEDHV